MRRCPPGSAGRSCSHHWCHPEGGGSRGLEGGVGPGWALRAAAVIITEGCAPRVGSVPLRGPGYVTPLPCPSFWGVPLCHLQSPPPTGLAHSLRLILHDALLIQWLLMQLRPEAAGLGRDGAGVISALLWSSLDPMEVISSLTIWEHFLVVLNFSFLGETTFICFFKYMHCTWSFRSILHESF